MELIYELLKIQATKRLTHGGVTLTVYTLMNLPPSTTTQLQSLNTTIIPVIYNCLAFVSILNLCAGFLKSATL